MAYAGQLAKLKCPSYSSYISHVQSGSSNTAITYWQSFLAGIEPCHFPLLNDRIAESKQQMMQVRFEHSLQLHKFCENNLTLSHVLQVAWGLVLLCFTCSDEVCFGYLTSGRNAPVSGIQDAVGVFINMLVCRMSLAGMTRLDQALERAQGDFIRSLSYQHCSLAEIQHDLPMSGASLFNTAISLQKALHSRSSKESVLSFDCVAARDPTEVRTNSSWDYYQ
jgi:hypothetical protein